MPLLRRRSALAGLSALPLLSAGLSARAQTTDFPDRPLRFVVGFPPGGPNDLLTRLVAPGIGERLGRNVVVENRAGANGEIAAASVAKAPTDGSVFMLASNGSTTVAPALNNMPYDVRTDFAAVAPVGINPMLLVVRPDLPAKNVAELLALAHDRPGKLNGASAGAGGATHLALELFKSMGKADIVHVPYKGGGPAMADLMASMVDIYFGGLSTALPHVKAGKLRALGQTARSARPRRPTSRPSPSRACRATRPRSPTASSCRPAHRRLWSTSCTTPSTRPSARPRSRRSSPTSAPIRSSARRRSSRPTSPTTMAKWARVAKDAGLKVE